MLLTAALLIISCDVRGTESSIQGVVQTRQSMRCRLDDEDRQVESSLNGRPWREFTGSTWEVEQWDEDRVVLRSKAGSATFDLKALTFSIRDFQHRAGTAVELRARAACKVE